MARLAYRLIPIVWMVSQAAAQVDPATTPTQPPAQPTDPSKVTLDQLPPQVRIGARAQFVRRAIPTIPTIVIVDDPDHVADAIALWSPTSRFPVLIDDGSVSASEDIARFVRAFQPRDIVRWTPASPMLAQAKTPAAKREAIERALALAWDAPEGDSAQDHWKAIQLAPLGAVCVDDDDSAWTGALVLAAAYAQHLIWIDPPKANPNSAFTYDQVRTIAKTIEADLTRRQDPWDTQGDEIDALTICGSIPIKSTYPDEKGPLALTDLLGRHLGKPGTPRYAWCGQVLGRAPRSTYNAMCSLFLRPRYAWGFDGYEDVSPFSAFDITDTARYLVRAKMAVLINDGIGSTSERDFRIRATGRLREPWEPDEGDPPNRAGLDVDFVLINSSGNQPWFDLNPGRAMAADAPFLNRPAIVNFVHSWSIARPSDRGTVGGRWLSRGAYAYVGSVHEPYLSAFVPTPLMVRRFISGAPLGVAARLDDEDPWKIAILGNPLTVSSETPPRADGPAPITGGRPLTRDAADALRDADYERALRNLVILGRDHDALRALDAIENDTGAPPTTSVLAHALMPAFRRADNPRLIRIAGDLLDAESNVMLAKDAAWHALYPTLGTLTDDELILLKRCVRPGSTARDATEIATAIRFNVGGDDGAAAGRLFIRQIRDATPPGRTRDALDRELGRFP